MRRLRDPMRDWTAIGAVVAALVIVGLVILLMAVNAPYLDGG